MFLWKWSKLKFSPNHSHVTFKTFTHRQPFCSGLKLRCRIQRRNNRLRTLTCPGSSPSSWCWGSSSGSPCRTSSHCPWRQSSSSPPLNCSDPAQRRLCLLRAPSTTLSSATGSRTRTVPVMPCRWKSWCRRKKRLTNNRTRCPDSVSLRGQLLPPQPAVSSSVVKWTRSKMAGFPEPWHRCGVKRTVGGSASFWKTRSWWGLSMKTSRGLVCDGKLSKQHTSTCAAILDLLHRRCCVMFFRHHITATQWMTEELQPKLIAP